MTFRPDHEQFHVEFGREVNNAPHRMPRHDVGVQLHMAFFRHRACALKDAADAPGGSCGLLSHLFGEFRQMADLFGRHHVQLRLVLLRYRKRHPQRVKRIFRSVVGMKDFAEHATRS